MIIPAPLLVAKVGLDRQPHAQEAGLIIDPTGAQTMAHIRSILHAMFFPTEFLVSGQFSHPISIPTDNVAVLRDQIMEGGFFRTIVASSPRFQCRLTFDPAILLGHQRKEEHLEP